MNAGHVGGTRGSGFVSSADDVLRMRFQTTQPTSGGAVTTVTNCCANCVETSRP